MNNYSTKLNKEMYIKEEKGPRLHVWNAWSLHFQWDG